MDIFKNNNVIIIGGGVAALLLLIAITFLLQSQFSSKLPEQEDQSQAVPTDTPQDTWQEHTTAHYSMQIPHDWKSSLETGNGIIITTFTPGHLPPGHFDPSLSVIREEGIIDHTQKKSIFLALGMEETVREYNGTAYEVVTGTYPVKVVEGQTRDEPMQETDLFLHKEGATYTVKYMYAGTKKNEEKEKLLNEMMNTLILY